MADISSIKLPNGNSYNFKDTSARSSLNNTGTNANLLVMEYHDLDNQTMNLSSNANFSVTITKSGYTPINIVGWRLLNASTNGVNCSWCEVYGVYLSNSTTAVAKVRNYANDTAKIRIRIYVLYKKN